MDKIDFIEIRCDNNIPTKQDLIRLLKSIKKVYSILTVRNEKFLLSRESHSLLKNYLESSGNYIDIDYKLVSFFLQNRIDKNKIIASYHNYKDICNFEKKFFLIKQLGTKFVKIAVTPQTLYDLVKIYRFGKNISTTNTAVGPSDYQQLTTNLILIAMGRMGIISRILYKRFGSFLTYACIDKNEETAPGQISIDDLISIYRIKKINEQTKLFGILGQDIQHSLSPIYYNRNFALLNLNCVYIPIDTFSLAGFKDFSREFGFCGFSITSPYKNKLKKYIKHYKNEINYLKIINTLKIRNNDFYGYNTDITALLAILNELKKNSSIKNVLILGSGSMAKTTLFALRKMKGIENIYIYSHHKMTITENQKPNPAHHIPHPIDLIINCSRFGLEKKKDTFYEKILPFTTKNTACIELNYKIIDTPLIKTAKGKGSIFYTGLDFFKKQFQSQFKVFFNINPSISLKTPSRKF